MTEISVLAVPPRVHLFLKQMHLYIDTTTGT